MEGNSSGRETILTVALVGLLGGGIFFFLNFISFGIFSYVFAIVLAITLLGYLHYALWGYAFSQEVAGEREEEEQRLRLEAEQEERFHQEIEP